MDYNNENLSPLRPKPQSRLQSPKKFNEMSSSAINARSSAMPPPSKPTKYKTFAERGGEVRGSSQLSVDSKLPVTAAPLTSFAMPLHEGFLSSSISSSRSNSVAPSRKALLPNGRGSVSKLPAAQGNRSQSAASNYRNTKQPSSQMRSASSLETRSVVSRLNQIGGKSTGRTPFPLNPTAVSRKPVIDGINESYEPYKSYYSLRVSKSKHVRESRNISLSMFMNASSFSSQPTAIVEQASPPQTPSSIPIRTQSAVGAVETQSTRKTPKKTTKLLSSTPFLTRYSNIRAAWDMDTKTETMDNMSSQFFQGMEGCTMESIGLKEKVLAYKKITNELESAKSELMSKNTALEAETDAIKSQLRESNIAIEDCERSHRIQIDDLQRQHRYELEDANRKWEEDIRQRIRHHEEEKEGLRKRLESALEDESMRRQADAQAAAREYVLSQQRIELEFSELRKVISSLENDLRLSKEETKREQSLNGELRVRISETVSQSMSLEASMRSLRAQIEFLESDNKSQSHAFVDLETRLQNAIRTASEANEKLRNEETLRRKLHNQVQELKGNIRVFCRVRPTLDSDPADQIARISYPDMGADSREVEILGQEEKSSLGNSITRKSAFSFDRVFTPTSANEDVFAEISQLVQSALDGYNVCIFCYGQTGSGKTYTMSAEDGMIPRAVCQIYDTARGLEEKGWSYSMEGSFIEVYNENLNDLLGKPDEFDKKKHEIRHDTQKCKTTVTDITTVALDNPTKVESILRQAAANRSVAATKANERSSRSHSIFILKLTGENSTTGEKSEGTLNLVDLAGSERISHSKATGDRLKETQNINKSLSCLGDVISALGQSKEGGHVPYRNSKLTYLLQYSLGGNSKTLMFVMVSPLQAHLGETLTSLKFATKVHNTHIGTAKRQTKTRDV